MKAHADRLVDINRRPAAVNVNRRYRPTACRLISLALQPTARHRDLDVAVYDLGPIECRQVLIATLQLVASGVVQLQSPRQHGLNAEPHRCDRPECADANRVWNAAYKRRTRAAA